MLCIDSRLCTYGNMNYTIVVQFRSWLRGASSVISEQKRIMGRGLEG